MSKIKEFFVKIFSCIANFFRFLKKKVSQFFRMIADTKAYKKVAYVVGYIPNWISSRLKNKTRKVIWGIIFLVPLTIGFIYFFFIPFVYTVIFSFSYVVFENGQIQMDWIGMGNYKFISEFANVKTYDGNVTFWEYVVESLIDIITDIPIILIFSMIMAVVLNSNFRGRAAARAIFFIPVIFNSQAIDTAVKAYSSLANTNANATNDLFSQMFNFKDFLTNAKMPVVFVNFLGDASTKIYDIISFSGIQILIFLSAIQSVPRHLYEAAKMEGATQYEMFWKITLPMISPMLLAAAVYTVVDSFLRSPILTIFDKYQDAGTVKEAAANVPLEFGKYFEDLQAYQLSNYGVNAAMAVIFTVIVAAVMLVVLGILSKVVFYYDE